MVNYNRLREMIVGIENINCVHEEEKKNEDEAYANARLEQGVVPKATALKQKSNASTGSSTTHREVPA